MYENEGKPAKSFYNIKGAWATYTNNRLKLEASIILKE